MCGFDCDWPYPKPVFVLSSTLTEIPAEYRDKATLVSGPLKQILAELQTQGLQRLYIDGGKTVQGFMKESLIDEMIITRLPIVLGGGAPLFGDLPGAQTFEHVGTTVLLDAMVQSHYRRVCA